MMLRDIARAARRVGLCGLIALMIAGCSAVDVLNATVPRDGYRLAADQSFGEKPRDKLDVYVPTAPAPGNPVIVFIYGGSWSSGERRDYLFVAQALASRGMTVVVPDYGLYPEVKYPDFLTDNAAAVRWTRDNIAVYGGNPGRMFLMGHSAGAYNAAMLAIDGQWLQGAGVDPKSVRGLIGLAGPYDFLPLDGPVTQRTFGDWPDLPSTQPINKVRPGAPPALLVHGDADDTVRPANAGILAGKLRAVGTEAEVKMYPGIGHIGLVTAMTGAFRGRAPVLDDVVHFIAEHP